MFVLVSVSVFFKTPQQAEAIRENIGYPEYLTNKTALAVQYKGVRLSDYHFFAWENRHRSYTSAEIQGETFHADDVILEPCSHSHLLLLGRLYFLSRERSSQSETLHCARIVVVLRHQFDFFGRESRGTRNNCFLGLITAMLLSGFQLSVVKPKLKLSLWPITTDENKTRNQSELEANTHDKRGKTRATKSRLVLVWHLIG